MERSRCMRMGRVYDVRTSEARRRRTGVISPTRPCPTPGRNTVPLKTGPTLILAGMPSASEPSSAAQDPRVYLAAERTLLAWIRTGLALMGFGFVVARFGLFLRELAVE